MPSMTVLLSRSPLQTLSMTSTQRPTRRRSARHAFEDEEAPAVAAKRTRTETNEAGKTAASAKTNGAAAKKAKAAYDENDDGFQFSRARSKKTQPKAPPAAEPTQERSKPAPTRRKRNSVSAPAPVESDAPVKRRRSARLSEDKEQITPAPEPKPRRTRKPAAESKVFGDQDDGVDFVGSVRTPGNELHVEKKRDGATKIALPFADTPIIRRNKEMRKGSAQGHRRSSTGMRGRRASSLIDSGASNAVPHAEVETRDFYKHIEQTLPEPRRMKQLLTWCGARALPEKPSGNVRDINAIMAARAIQQELLDDFASRSEMSDWFSREDTAPSVLIKKPNPQNERNASMLQELEQEIKRLQEEKAAWEALTASSKLKTMPPPPLPSKSPPRPNSAAQPLLPQIDPSLLDPSQTAILAALQPQPPDASTSSDEPTTSSAPLSSAFTFTSPTSLQSRLTHLSSSLEPTVDLLADGVHKISQYRLTAERVADRILGSAAERLEQRDRDARERAGTEGVGVGDVLGALGRMLNGR